MKYSRISRSTSASIAATLFVWAQASAFCQNFGSSPQTVVTKNEAYLVGATQMIAPANATFTPHPQGRYALVTQNDVPLPPGPLLGQSSTGAVSLLLYDARLNKTKPLLVRRADGGKHTIESVNWIAQTDCAVVVVRDVMPPTPNPNAPPVPGSETLNDDTVDTYITNSNPLVQASTKGYTLLFFDFSKSLTPRVLGTSADGFYVNVSPLKPLFVVLSDKQIRMGSAPRGTFGPAREMLPRNFFDQWNTDGTSLYEVRYSTVKDSPDAKPRRVENWYVWNGQTPEAVELKSKPTKTMVAQEPERPTLPVMLTGGSLTVPAALPRSPFLSETEYRTPHVPVTPVSAAKTGNSAAITATPPVKPTPKKAEPVLHPLFLEATDDPAAPRDASPNRSALIAADAPAAYLLSDQSAVLYQSGGALYAVPIVRLNAKGYAQLQKAQAMQKAKQAGLAIMMYTQDYDDVYPLQENATEAVQPYLKDPTILQSFTYQRPQTPVKTPATTVMGYLATPSGRAVVYVDGHVEWKDAP